MKSHRKAVSLLVALLLATVAFRQAQEQFQVLVASDGTAALRIHTTDGEPGLSGSLRASNDLAAGSSALRADLRMEDADELGDATVDAFLRMTAGTIELIGKADVPLTAEDGDGLDEFAYTFESVTGGETSYTTLALEMATPADEPVPAFAVDGTMEGSSEAFSGTVDYTVTVSEQQAGQIPVTDLSLTLAEETTGSGESETVTTTLTLSVTAPKGSPVEQQLRQAPEARPMFEQQLQGANLQVDTVEIPPVEETDTTLTAHATVAVSGLRGTLEGLIGMAGPGMARDSLVDAQALTAALRKMLGIRVDSFELTMSVEGTTVSGRMGGRVSRWGEFLGAYMDIIRMAVENASAAREDAEPAELAAFMTAFQEVNMEQSARTLELMLESDMSFRGDGRLELSSAEGRTNLDGEFDLNVDNYRDFAERAEAAGLPMADTALVVTDLRLTDAGRFDGRFYGYSDGGLLAYYKELVLAALARAGGTEEATSLVEETNLEEAAYSLTLRGQDVELRGYSQTTPLTGAGRAVLGMLAPQVEGTLDGAYVDYTFNPDGTGRGDVLVRFTDFMPNRSAAEIREALDLPETADVQMDAAPDAVTLTQVERPEVQPSAELAGIQSSARERLASIGGGGGPNWMLIVGGLLVVALVGVGLAAARRRA